MPQRHIVKSCTLHSAPVERNMFLITPVCQEDLKRFCPSCRKAVIQRPGYFSAVITQPVHGGLKLWEIHILWFLTKKRKYILTPPECAIIGV